MKDAKMQSMFFVRLGRFRAFSGDTTAMERSMDIAAMIRVDDSAQTRTKK